MNNNTNIIYGVALIGVFLLGFILWNLDYSEQQEATTDVTDIFVCGTPGPRSEIEHQGGVVFKSNCAACHRIFKPMTGPALFDVVEQYPSDSLLLEYVRKYKIKDGKYCLQFDNLTFEDVSLVNTYIKSFN